MKNIFIENRRGITLIALVITIIVILMLVGIAISMIVGENGIIQKANIAKKANEAMTVDEKVKLAIMTAITAGQGKIIGVESYRVLNEELNKIGYNGELIKENVEWPITISIDKNDFTIEENGTINRIMQVKNYVGVKITDSNAEMVDEIGENIVVPVGFKIKEDSTKLVKEGIVVVAPDGSEFVWIPVNNPSTMYGIDSVGNKVGKLYDWTSLDKNKIPANLNWTEENGIMSLKNTTGNREPDILVEYDNSSSNTIGLTKNKIQKDFSKMIESVILNKGFYIGRYETSLREKTDKDGNIVKIAQSKKGQTSATGGSDSANTWYGLYQVENEYSSKNNFANIVESSMIWGCQYDQMMLWMNNNGIDVNSLNPTNLDGVTASKNETKITGNEQYDMDKLNNVYDLLGCNYEWTLEALGEQNRPWRGGVNDWNASVANRDNNTSITPNLGFTWVSSRITLYIK